MKTFVFAMMFVGLLNNVATARPKKKIDNAPQAGVEQQLANRVTYPSALHETQGNSIVVVQFRLDEQNRVTDLRVHSANRTLNDELTKQLTNAEIKPTEPVGYVQQVYTARLRFVK